MPSILIVEDDITFSLMLKTWLGKKGFEVKTFSSVSDAKRQIENGGYDLIRPICVYRMATGSIC